MSLATVKTESRRRLGVLFGVSTLFISCTSSFKGSGGGANGPAATPNPQATVKPESTPLTPIRPGPTFQPRVIPTAAPTAAPTIAPTTSPSVAPTITPTFVPRITPEPAPAGASLTFNAIPFVNMEQGEHASDAGKTFILENGGTVVAVGAMRVSAANRGKAIDGGGAYVASQLKIDTAYVNSSAPQSGTGEISICTIKGAIDQNTTSANCIQTKNDSPFAELGSSARPTTWSKVSAPYTIQNGNVTVSNKVYGNGDQVTGGLSLNHIIFTSVQGAQVATNDDGSSPLVFDLDGDGKVSLTDVQQGPKAVYFDILNLGFKVSTGWVKPNDGLLAIDFNGDGKIADGSQLFGEASRSIKKVSEFQLSPFMDGFQALAQYDEYHEGMITAKNSVFSKLRIWRDKNGNGISEPGELTTLAQEKIVGISLTKELLGKAHSWPKVEGNEIRLQGYFVRENGQKGKIFDVWFTQDKKTVAKK